MNQHQPTMRVYIMSINVRLTNAQFYHMYKDNEFLRGMSYHAVYEVLAHISEVNVNLDEVVDWTSYFMNAREYTLEEFIEAYGYLANEHDASGADGDDEELVYFICEYIDAHVRRFFIGNDTLFVVID